jgi:hydroxypyruvate isomerase
MPGNKRTNRTHSPRPSRRGVLKGAAAAALASAIMSKPAVAAENTTARAVKHGRVNQSVIQWCFAKHWDLEQLARNAAALGCRSVELVDPKNWDVLNRHGLTCAIASSHGFVKGFNDPANWDFCTDRITKAVEASAEFGCPNVITFTGMRANIPDDVGLENCVKGLKKVIPLAERKKVTLCIEMLNSRVNEEMKGHPGYQGDHTDYCIEICKRVNSERMKLLFDIYHVQIMDGDVIRRIRQHKDYIGHVHTAGNPGRCELDDTQEINYPPIMRALLEVGYKGFVGQEFIPTRDPMQGLREAVALCDV